MAVGQKLSLTWRQLLLLPFPRFLAGFRLSDWFRLLRAHRFRVDPPFWPRAVSATLGCAITSCLARLEERCARGQVETELWESPIFILGLPRSGTTHLFELLSQSPQLCFPTRFDAFKPHTFLFLRRVGLFGFLAKLGKFKRAMDNVRVGWDTPEEDIVALSVLTSRGDRLRQVFPRDAAIAADSPADAFATREESLHLLRALRAFTRKLVLLHRKQVLLKSPVHMARVKEILEVFPRAKFVVIFRNPLHQAGSLVAARESGNPFWCALQWPIRSERSTPLLRQGRILSRYFEARPLIPEENLIEITFEELVADRTRTVGRICAKLGLVAPLNADALTSTSLAARSPSDPPPHWIPFVREHYKPLFETGLYVQP